MAQPAPKRILIVDDEENVCHALRRSLRKEGYELFFGHEPAEGLEVLKKQPVDMVISDHLMPNMTGLEFLKLVRDRYPDVMRLILTGHADMQTAIDAINQGAIYRFLTKPWDDTDLEGDAVPRLRAAGSRAREPQALVDGSPAVRSHQEPRERLPGHRSYRP